jgi:CRP/FNR family transcriptional regulator, cyclic AMP receptor protein
LLGATLRTRDRPFFTVEERVGWGVFNRLRILPDLPLDAVREMGRFVKNQRHGSMEEVAIRAPIEAGAAVFRSLIGPLADVQALIGDVREDVAKPNLDFFHAPSVVIHGAVPYFTAGSYLQRGFEVGTAFPFALLMADLASALPRLDAVERALAVPGRRGILALLALRKEPLAARSSLEPENGLPLLTDAVIPEQSAPMATRRRILDFGGQLRANDLFRDLSVAEAAVLGTFMERVEATAGEVILRHGSAGDALLLIEAGEADVQVEDHAGRRILLDRRGPGDYVGEIALVTDSVRIADVIASTPMTLLRLGREPYVRYLRHLVEVEQHLASTAAARIASTRQQLAGGSRE